MEPAIWQNIYRGQFSPVNLFKTSQKCAQIQPDKPKI